MNIETILDFIKDRWAKTTRCNTKGEGTLIGLPYPYTIPCVKDAFQELYYWDTYFASRGLELHGYIDQVKNNCDNFIYEVEQFGFIPNGSRTFYLNRSQPPYLGALIDLVYRHRPDRDWLEKAVGALETEYLFWTTRRSLGCGLLHYGHHVEDESVYEEFYKGCCVGRMGMDPGADAATRRACASHTIAEAESGWDFNPRFERRCMDYAPVDLNSLIYYDEVLLGKFKNELGKTSEAACWRERAERRANLINLYCWDEAHGVFMDYDSKRGCFSPVFSAASLYPLWVGLASPGQAATTVKRMEELLEYPHGLSTCERNESGYNYQWDYPNGWPCLQVTAIDALSRYGYHVQAGRIARKYIDTVMRCFELCGDIWEKYNVETGTIEVKGEYKMPAMMGWSAAAFLVAVDYLRRGEG